MKSKAAPVKDQKKDKIGDASQLGRFTGVPLDDEQKKLVSILPPQDVVQTLRNWRDRVNVVMLDPWYNKGVGGVRDDYDDWLCSVVESAGRISEHVYVWGFPEIIWRLLNRLPGDLTLVAWLTWYYRTARPLSAAGGRLSTRACTFPDPRRRCTRSTF